MAVENQEQVLENEESLEDVGGFIIKNANQHFWDGVDDDEQPTSDADVTEPSEPSSTTDEPDLSLFDDLDKAQESEPEKPEDTEQPETVEFTKFSEDFKKHLGFDIKEAMTMVQELQTLRQEIVVREQETNIKSSWGVDDATYQERMNEVRTYAANIQQKNPEMFNKLDNVEGVKLIWAKIESEKRKGNKATVPSIQTSGNKTPATTKSAFDFTYSQLQKMSRDEYAKNANKIQRAFSNGRVDMKR